MRAHIFLCMLAYYVERHLRRVWRELLFADEEQAAKAERDRSRPPAVRSAQTRRPADTPFPVHSLRTLFDELATSAIPAAPA